MFQQQQQQTNLLPRFFIDILEPYYLSLFRSTETLPTFLILGEIRHHLILKLLIVNVPVQSQAFID